jgi:hypothetical protein
MTRSTPMLLAAMLVVLLAPSRPLAQTPVSP